MSLQRPFTSFRLPGTPETLSLLSDLWTEEHIFYALDKRVKTFYGAHRLFSRIESGEIRVYGAFTYEGYLCGICFGYTEFDPAEFSAHIAFLRHVDGKACALLLENAIVKDYAAEGLSIDRICGYIPEYNRAAIILAKRYGCVDLGVDETKTVLCGDHLFPCRILQKELR